jgi:hypothetical protein
MPLILPEGAALLPRQAPFATYPEDASGVSTCNLPIAASMALEFGDPQEQTLSDGIYFAQFCRFFREYRLPFDSTPTEPFDSTSTEPFDSTSTEPFDSAANEVLSSITHKRGTKIERSRQTRSDLLFDELSPPLFDEPPPDCSDFSFAELFSVCPDKVAKAKTIANGTANHEDITPTLR